MDLRYVRAFVTVAETRHFGRAAERLHLAQPALSHQIKALERALDVTLFDRTTRRVELTAAGRRFVDHAHRLLTQAAHAADDLERIATGRAGQVSVGFIGTATYDVLPRLAREVRQQLPDVDLRLRGELLTPQLLQGLADFEFDLVVHRTPDTVPSGVETRRLRTEPLLAVLPRYHPLAAREIVGLDELAGETFVIHPAGGLSSMHATVLAACAAHGFRPSSVVEVSETATLVVFVAAGLGVALVPEPVRALGLDGVAYRTLADAPRVDLMLSTRAGDPSAATRRVAGLIETSVR